MSKYAIIVQNDESDWDDVKGDLYHYPATYKAILTPGCRIVYYKGQMRDQTYLKERLSPQPHYFGVGVVGESILDPNSTKKDRYCEILEYQEFEEAVLAKNGGVYLEDIPKTKVSNYWRFGVRDVSREVFDRIIGMAKLTGYTPTLPHLNSDLESYHTEGTKKFRYSTYYERNPFYRTKAIEIHGLVCMSCGIDFAFQYGEWGAGFIHVHHNKPISETGPTRINPQTDMSVVCPNCHAMIHRKRDITLTAQDVKQLFEAGT
ncbi:HNH endonuclease [bacterium]|nr:HNH endonuclease [bacterium]